MQMNMKLKFWANPSLSVAVNNQANYRYRPTAAFDIDPALGGTSMAGFAELAGFYNMYRVLASKISVTVANPSALYPITVIVIPMNADPTNAETAANVVASVGNPYAKTKQTGLLGSPPVVIENSMQTEIIYGDPQIFYDHNFASAVTTVPTNNWFWNVAIYVQTVFATAVILNVQITVDVEFFDRFFLPA